MESTMKQLIFSKDLKPAHIKFGIDIPVATFPEFGIPQGEGHVFVQVKDEAGITRSFKLATRRNGNNFRATIANADWHTFVRMNQLREGDNITFNKIKKQANGECVGYELELKAAGAIRVFGAIIGRQ